jgi:hypothetical protein
MIAYGHLAAFRYPRPTDTICPMSQMPPPPLGYATRLPDSNPRPTTVTTIAIIAIVLSSVALLGVLCAFPQYLGLRLIPNPVMDAQRQDGLLLGYMMGSMLVSLVLAVMQLYGAIQSLYLKPTGRIWLIRFAWMYTAVIVLSVMATVGFVQAHTDAATQKALAQNATLNTPQMRQFTSYGHAIRYCCPVIYLIWPILVLYFMNRPHVKAAFGAAPYEQMQRPPLA